MKKIIKKYIMLIALFFVILIFTSIIWTWPSTDINTDINNNNNNNNNVSKETGIVSGRILYDNILLKPVYNASVLVNGKTAEIYGTTYLATNVSTGEITIEAQDNNGQTIRKNLKVEPSIVNSFDLIYPANDVAIPPDVTLTSDHIQFDLNNGISMKLNITDDKILGIGEVKADGIPLRKPLLTGIPRIEKIENGKFVGIENGKCTFINYETIGETVIVHSKLNTAEGDIDLDWIFTPWIMNIDDNQYKGLGYRFSISSPMNFSKMEFKCSWELNEKISGKTLLTRCAKTYWERDVIQSEGFNINLSSLFSLSQPPVYHYNNNGALASYIYPPNELDNILQKDENSDQLWFYDKFSFGETKEAETPFRIILYTNKSGIDEYTYLLDEISENYRKFYGLEEVDPIPTVLASSYLQPMLLGQPPNFRNLADNWLKEFKDNNFKQVIINYLWLSNGRIGTPYSNNRLATFSIDIHSDDVDDVKYLVSKSHDLNMDFTVWFSICFSIDSPIYEKNDWQITNVDGRYQTAPSREVYLMSYRSGYLQYALDRLKIIHDEFEFDGIWHDYFGAASKIDYSDATIRPPFDQQMQYLSATQQMGYTPYTESLGPFGMTGSASNAVTPFGSSHEDRDINAAFGGKEYLAYKTSFILFSANDFSPLQVDYYKFLANKATPMLAYVYLSETEKEIISQANKDYITALSYMDKRHILPDEKGILWNDTESNTQILFAYKKYSYNLEENITEVYDITNNSVVNTINGSFDTQIKHTYKLK